jgi:two-component system sensor histidine kinase BaeS
VKPWRSLRARLIVAFAAIIGLTLVIVGGGFVVILRQFQEQRETLRLGTLSTELAFTLRQAEIAGTAQSGVFELLRRRSDELDIRSVILGPQGTIIFDSEDQLVGHRLELTGIQRTGPLRRTWVTLNDPMLGRLTLVFSNPAALNPEARAAGRAGPFALALVHEPPTYASVLQEMAPRLLVAAAISMLASIGVAWVLAASITRPLRRMTLAVEQLAQGNYAQAIPDQGDDDVGRLGQAFNSMAQAVGSANRTLRDLVANVSHDLRTPLTSIQGFSQAMVDGALTTRDEYAEAGRIVHEEANRMARMVEDLLELSKLESRQISLELVPTSLNDVVAKCVKRVEPRATQRGVSIRLHSLAEPIVRADAARLERVFDNLLVNAIKFTPPGGSINVGVGGPPGQDRAWVTVHNTGSYIPADKLERIFERFYRADKSRSDVREGSGLGLAIAHELIQQHKGSIDVTSSPDDGTSFRVNLPQLDRKNATRVASPRVAAGTRGS